MWQQPTAYKYVPTRLTNTTASDRPELTKLIAEAISWFNALPPEEQQRQIDAQRDSYVRGELSWPRDCPYR